VRNQSRETSWGTLRFPERSGTAESPHRVTASRPLDPTCVHARNLLLNYYLPGESKAICGMRAHVSTTVQGFLHSSVQFWAELSEVLAVYLTGMAANGTLLCIHRDPAQLSLLQENGYELVTATNSAEGLRLLMSRTVDAIVLEYHLGLLDGAVVATEIKKVRPQIPIVMLAEHLELPDGALKSVDALVTKADGDHFLWATVHSVLKMKPAPGETASRAQARARHRRPDSTLIGPDRSQANPP